MTEHDFAGADAQALRAQWFRLLDAVEPVRGALHGYCLRLTSNAWDAEDLVQDALLRGFGAIARGDLHGTASRVRNAQAYLFRVATNAWLDLARRRGRESAAVVVDVAADDADPTVAEDAVAKAIGLSSPQEFAAILLKDVYDFSLTEIADFVGTTTGTIKSALSRARRKMRVATEPARLDAATRRLAEAFAAAINAQDVDRVTALMSETVQIVVCNVGGGRGREGVWTAKSIPGCAAEYREFQGAPTVVLIDPTTRRAKSVVRIEGSAGSITKIVDYCYAPETLDCVAEGIGVRLTGAGYHQPRATLATMIASTDLPWLGA